MFKLNIISFLLLIFSSQNFFAQEKKIEIISASSLDKDATLYPDANILRGSNSKQVHLRHDNMDIYSNNAIFFQKKNKFIAMGDVFLKQGDSLELNCDSLNYNGRIKKFFSYGKVSLINNKTKLNSNELFYDRENNIASFFNGGNIIDSLTTIQSEKGDYLLDFDKYKFRNNIVVTNPNYVIESESLDYVIGQEKTYFLESTKITGDSYEIICNRGFYNGKLKRGHFLDDATINMNERIIKGDSIFFDNEIKYASAAKNISIFDTTEKIQILGEFAEVFEKKDSAIVTINPIAVNTTEIDSLFIAADTLYSVGDKKNRIIKGLNNVKLFKKNMSGKSDFIHIDEKKGITRLMRKVLKKKELQIMSQEQINMINPILWDGNSQISGDEIVLKEDIEENKLDSLIVTNNGFIIEKDTIGLNNYNQIKGIRIFGKFFNGKIKNLMVDQNAEIIYYMYNDVNELIGIDKAVSSSIMMIMSENGIDKIRFITDPEGMLYPESFLEENEKFLEGFISRENEKINNKLDLFY